MEAYVLERTWGDAQAAYSRRAPMRLKRSYQRLRHIHRIFAAYTEPNSRQDSYGAGPGSATHLPHPCWTQSLRWPLRIVQDHLYTKPLAASRPRMRRNRGRAMEMQGSEIEESSPGASRYSYDIGKVWYRGKYLNKNCPLNPAEWATDESHVSLAPKFLDPLTLPRALIRRNVAVTTTNSFDVRAIHTLDAGEYARCWLVSSRRRCLRHDHQPTALSRRPARRPTRSPIWRLCRRMRNWRRRIGGAFFVADHAVAAQPDHRSCATTGP